jgi:hypothetical protein
LCVPLVAVTAVTAVIAVVDGPGRGIEQRCGPIERQRL